MPKSTKFGTFGGVFTPSILTILGVIMYLRLPMIVGEAGLLYTIGIIVVAHIISATTGLSVSSIATDKKVKAGGTYFMISRSLGLPIGGTLGLALFVGLSFSVSLYLIGFSESFLNYFDFETNLNTIRITGTIILLAVTTITFISTSLAIKSQYFIMTAIILSLLSIFFGNHDLAPEAPLFSNPGSTIPLMTLFGIFFPAVTGFEAGVSMSGDLKDPKKSIPLGAILAISVGLVTYVGLAFFFAYNVEGDALRNDPRVLLKISRIPELVIAGIWGATISSALGSILGAPRILQATAADKIAPRFFAKGVGATNEPRNALILTFVIAEAGILIGQLDVIARIVSIFFITTYAFLNLSCAFERWTSADFRPSFKTPVWVGFLGSAACFLVMIQLDFLATLGASIILGLLFLYLKRKELSLQSGDAWSGVWASLVKTGLERLNREKVEARNWRPNIIMFVGNDKDRPYMADFGISIAGKLGVLSAFELIEAEKPLLIKNEKQVDGERPRRNYFFHRHYCREVYEGMDEISRIYGFSGIEPNTILMGWSKRKNHEKFLKLIESFERSNYNTIFLNYDRERKFGQNKNIDIWWGGWGRNLSFAIYLINYITSSDLWKESSVRLLVVNPDNTKAEKIYKSLERILNNFRVKIEINIINNGIDQLPVDTVIERESAQTDLTIIGIPGQRKENFAETYRRVSDLADKLGTSIFINASTYFDEYDLEIDNIYRKEETVEDLLALPELKLSKYPEVADDVKMADEHGQKVLEVFFKKTFTDYFAINRQINDEMQALSEFVDSSFHKIALVNDNFRKSKAISRLRSEFYFRSKKILRNLVDKQLNEQKESLETGVEWYVGALQRETNQFPKELKIKYSRAELKLKKEEPGEIKWIKLRLRYGHPFSGASVPGYVNYRRVAQYYLRDNRYNFLAAYLAQFEKSAAIYLNQLYAAISFVDNQFDKIEKKIAEESLSFADLTETGKLITAKSLSLQEEQDRIKNLYLNRLRVEFRRNIQLFNNDLEKLNINKLIQKKRRGKNYYLQLKENNLEYSQSWYEKMLLIANKHFLDTSVLSFRERVYHETEEFVQETLQNTENKFLFALGEIERQLLHFKVDKKELKGLKWQKLPASGDELVADFDERGKKLIKLASELPETLKVSFRVDEDLKQSEDEVFDVHVSRITQHFLESQYLSPVLEHLEKASETIKSLVFNLNDMLSLAKFSMANIDSEIEDESTIIEETVNDTLKNIDKEKERVRAMKTDIVNETNKLLDEMFRSLSSYKIHESAREFSYLLRDYQSKKVLTRFGSYRSTTRNFFRDSIVKLLYSKSEGILLAKRLAEDRQMRSTNEKVLDIVEQVSPDYDVIEHLPHYYQSLFSGRSSIGENFWIKRDFEESTFKKAVDRYKEGYLGAIAVLGERNSGKTSFCMHVSKRHFSGGKVFNVFPSAGGSTNPDDFWREMQKVTQISGGSSVIMEALPPQSVFVFHDLELWWERTMAGMAVIRELEALIDNYSHKCLFIVNCNPFAYELINKIHPIEYLFIGTVTCQPFGSEELRNLVMSRHRSSGLNFVLNKRNERQMSEIKMAGLFNSYFDYSDGNPGVTLNAWLANVTGISATDIQIESPVKPNVKALGELPDDWNVLLLQMIIHKRLSIEKIRNVLRGNEDGIKDTLQSLLRSGLVKERSSGVYFVNNFVEPFLIKVYKQKEWL